MSKQHFIWEHYSILAKAANGGNKHKVRCNHCEREFTMGITRAKAHHAGVPGAGVACCKSTPPELRAQLVKEVSVG